MRAFERHEPADTTAFDNRMSTGPGVEPSVMPARTLSPFRVRAAAYHAGITTTVLGRHLDVDRRGDTQQIDAAPIGTQDAKLHRIHLDGLATARQATQLVHEQAADGVELFVGKLRVEESIELIDRRQRMHREFAWPFLANGLIFLDVVFIVDLADDLLDDILDGDQPADAAVFIDDDGDVVMVAAKLLQQHVEPLAFRHEHHRTHVLADLETIIAGRLQPQHILGQQHS
jgi:hypothetical protein